MQQSSGKCRSKRGTHREWCAPHAADSQLEQRWHWCQPCRANLMLLGNCSAAAGELAWQWQGGIGPRAVRAFVAFASVHVHVVVLVHVHVAVVVVLAHVNALDPENANIAEMGKGGPKGPEACAVVVEARSRSVCRGRRPRRAPPRAPGWVAGCRRFPLPQNAPAERLPDCTLRPAGGAANHKAGGAELASRPVAASRQDSPSCDSHRHVRLFSSALQ